MIISLCSRLLTSAKKQDTIGVSFCKCLCVTSPPRQQKDSKQAGISCDKRISQWDVSHQQEFLATKNAYMGAYALVTSPA